MKRLKRKDLLLLSIKLIEKRADPSNAKEHYNSYLIRNTNMVKGSKIITQQLNTIKQPWHCWASKNFT